VLTASDVRWLGLLGMTGNVPIAAPLAVVATDDENAVGGAEIFRPITGGAGRPMLRMNVLIESVRLTGGLSTTMLVSLYTRQRQPLTQTTHTLLH